ncbi:acetyltransferase [Enterococcus faecalis]|nr:acetyltransferase [Enterococcus faecalis]
MNQTANSKKKRYITGFDGIRTIAVIGVILYHLFPQVMRGGYLGVPIFFVVSGYLINDLLRQEWAENQTIDLKGFYVRRMKRLYPALIVMLLSAVSYITLFQQDLLNNIRSVVASSIFYYNNWWQIFKGFSYFDGFATQSPFVHIWSLAVEAQNYLIWPLLFILLERFVRKRGRIFSLVLIGALISVTLMAVLYVPGADPTRVYYGTDTRVFSILLGSALAYVWPSTRLKEEIPEASKKILNGAGLSALVLLVLAFLTLSDHTNFVYYGGMFLISLAATVLVAVTAHPGADMNRWLTNPVFTWIGKRSYGIYLYQFPIMIFYEAKIKTLSDHVFLHSLVEIALILVVSELSYCFIEHPLTRLSYKDVWTQFTEFLRKPWDLREKGTMAFMTVISVIAVFGLIVAPANAKSAQQEQLEKNIAKNQQKIEERKKEVQESGTKNSSTSTESSTKPSESQDVLPAQLTPEQVKKAQNLEITTIGDSVILDGASGLQDIFPKMIIDGEVGRQLYSSISLIGELDKKKMLKDTVLVSLGTNGPFTEAQFDEFMKALGNRKVYWINVRVPTRRWQNQVNSLLSQMDKKYDNLTVIDWFNYSNAHDDWFYDDRVHPNVAGGEQYTHFIAEKILQ